MPAPCPPAQTVQPGNIAVQTTSYLGRSWRRSGARHTRSIQAGHHKLQIKGFLADALIIIEKRNADRCQRTVERPGDEGGHVNQNHSQNRIVEYRSTRCRDCAQSEGNNVGEYSEDEIHSQDTAAAALGENRATLQGGDDPEVLDYTCLHRKGVANVDRDGDQATDDCGAKSDNDAN